MRYDSAKEVLETLIHAFYEKRDVELALSCVTDDVEWTGTEEEESGKNKEEVRLILQNAVRTIPGPFQVNFKVPREQKLTDEITIFSLKGQYMQVPGTNYDFPVRATICCVRTNDGWLISNIHVSTPNNAKIQERLKEALADAEHANKAKTQFLSRISHDMRTPLNGIKNYALFIESAKTLSEAKEYNEKIQISENYLQTLINDTLGMSRIESGKIILKPEPYIYNDFEPSIRNVVEPKAFTKGVLLRFIKPKKTQQYVMLDKLRIQQIFVNLLNNAIKFTPAGGIVEMKTELLNQTEEHEDIRFTVTDTGIGMSEDFLKNQLFKPFAQEHPGKDNDETGTGLGLSIVKQLVELMNGTIQCRSAQREGTSFVVTIPVDTVENYPAKIQENPKIDFKVLEGRRVLLCEDHPLNREIGVHLLKNVGCKVDVAEDGDVGVRTYVSEEAGYYDAILMDVRMPRMNGLEATQYIRSSQKDDAKTIPIIAMTANAFAEDVEMCLSVGMNAHIPKPVEPKELYITLTEQIMMKS